TRRLPGSECGRLRPPRVARGLREILPSHPMSRVPRISHPEARQRSLWLAPLAFVDRSPFAPFNNLRVLCGPLRLCVEYCVLLLRYPILNAKAQSTRRIDHTSQQLNNRTLPEDFRCNAVSTKVP